MWKRTRTSVSHLPLSVSRGTANKQRHYLQPVQKKEKHVQETLKYCSKCSRFISTSFPRRSSHSSAFTDKYLGLVRDITPVFHSKLVLGVL